MIEMVGLLLRKIQLAVYSSARSFDDFQQSHARYENLTKVCSQYAGELRPVYEQYVKEISPADMAASLELGGMLLALCRINQWKRLLDLGSGFSSYVFRYYAREHPEVTVISVDDDSEWLQRTAAFLESHRLTTENMLVLNEFLTGDVEAFDCILHDLNFVEVRIGYVDQVLAHLASSGLAIFDDVHKPDYRLALMKRLRTRSGKVYSLEEATLDQFGRFAYGFCPAAR